MRLVRAGHDLPIEAGPVPHAKAKQHRFMVAPAGFVRVSDMADRRGVAVQGFLRQYVARARSPPHSSRLFAGNGNKQLSPRRLHDLLLEESRQRWDDRAALQRCSQFICNCLS